MIHYDYKLINNNRFFSFATALLQCFFWPGDLFIVKYNRLIHNQKTIKLLYDCKIVKKIN